MQDSSENVLILSCPDQRGIVATVTALLFERGANIEESQQFYDERTDRFFMRIRFSAEAGGRSTDGWRELFAPVATTYGMEWSVRDAATPYRAVVMVSRFGHCLNDLLFRWRSGRSTSTSRPSCRTTATSSRSWRATASPSTTFR